ncbi:MAG: hypothetical protein ABIS50_10015 [Luteolibacter sp.]|uniref:hypothetical protein n=1 Tax=Luteolibacter sp. TaxID=1962973 RepID=UPI0032643EC6
MIPRKSISIPISLLVAGLLCLWWWKSVTSDKSEKSKVLSSQRSPGIRPTGESPVAAAFGNLQKSPARADALKTLTELQADLKAMPREEAVAWIRSFLNSSDDKPTGLSFVISKQGTLSEWPTFRIFLLDALLAIDPTAAALIGREILTKPTTSDEWALALRNVGKNDASQETNAYLREKTEALIANPAWQADPSIGYLNAFDVLVHTGATESTPLLSSLIQRKDRKDLAHAGFLTLDRLVQQQSSDVLARLSADRTLQESRPEMVSQEFARADLRDAAQREIVKTWLLDPARTGTELRSFAGVYPNNNQFISNNLLTTEASPSGSDLAAHDREALDIITGWEKDPAFSSVQEHLRSMISRLNGFVGGSGNAETPAPAK